LRDHKKYKGDTMFEVTEKAGSMIKNILEEQEGPNKIRILMQAG